MTSKQKKEDLLNQLLNGINLIHETLICGICLDQVKNPVRTKCGHRFCRFCLIKAIESAQSASRENRNKCPSCNQGGLSRRSFSEDLEGIQLTSALQELTEALTKDTNGVLTFESYPYKLDNVLATTNSVVSVSYIEKFNFLKQDSSDKKTEKFSDLAKPEKKSRRGKVNTESVRNDLEKSDSAEISQVLSEGVEPVNEIGDTVKRRQKYVKGRKTRQNHKKVVPEPFEPVDDFDINNDETVLLKVNDENISEALKDKTVLNRSNTDKLEEVQIVTNNAENLETFSNQNLIGKNMKSSESLFPFAQDQLLTSNNGMNTEPLKSDVENTTGRYECVSKKFSRKRKEKVESSSSKKRKIVFQLKGRFNNEVKSSDFPNGLFMDSSTKRQNRVLFVQLGRLSRKSARMKYHNFPTFDQVLAKTKTIEVEYSQSSLNDTRKLSKGSPTHANAIGVTYSPSNSLYYDPEPGPSKRLNSDDIPNTDPPANSKKHKREKSFGRKRRVSKETLVSKALKDAPNVPNASQSRNSQKLKSKNISSFITTQEQREVNNLTIKTSDSSLVPDSQDELAVEMPKEAKTGSEFTRNIIGNDNDLYETDEETELQRETRLEKQAEETRIERELVLEEGRLISRRSRIRSSSVVSSSQVSLFSNTAPKETATRDQKRFLESSDDEIEFSSNQRSKPPSPLKAIENNLNFFHKTQEQRNKKVPLLSDAEDDMPDLDHSPILSATSSIEDSYQDTTSQIEQRLEDLKRQVELEDLKNKQNQQMDNINKEEDENEDSSDEDILESTPQVKPPRKRSLQLSAAAREREAKRVRKSLLPDFQIDNMVFLITGLSQEQRGMFGQFTKKFRCKTATMVDHQVTHVIVQTRGMKADRTLKYLQAVALGRMVISFEWVRECLKVGAILNPENFEALDDSGESGPKKSRIAHENQGPKLFEDIEFCLQGNFQAISKEHFKKILQNCGAKIVRSAKMPSNTSKFSLVIVDKESKGFDEEGCLRNFASNDVAAVDKDWLIDSIGTYSVRPILEFLVHHATLKSLIHAGYKDLALFETQALC